MSWCVWADQAAQGLVFFAGGLGGAGAGIQGPSSLPELPAWQRPAKPSSRMAGTGEAAGGHFGRGGSGRTGPQAPRQHNTVLVSPKKAAVGPAR